MAAYAKQISTRDGVDSGTVVHYYVWYKGKMAATKEKQAIACKTGSQALKLLESDADAPQEINHYVRKYVDIDRLDVDSQDYLELVVIEV